MLTKTRDLFDVSTQLSASDGRYERYSLFDKYHHFRSSLFKNSCCLRMFDTQLSVYRTFQSSVFGKLKRRQGVGVDDDE